MVAAVWSDRTTAFHSPSGSESSVYRQSSPNRSPDYHFDNLSDSAGHMTLTDDAAGIVNLGELVTGAEKTQADDRAIVANSLVAIAFTIITIVGTRGSRALPTVASCTGLALSSRHFLSYVGPSPGFGCRSRVWSNVARSR